MTGSWKEYNMGELVSLRQGFAVNKKSNHHISETRTEFPLLKISDLLNGTETLFVKRSIPSQFLVEPHEIIYSRTGQVGYAFIGRKGVVYNNCFRVTPNEKIDSVFLYHLLNSEPVRELAKVLATGSAQPDLNHGAFKSIKVTIPPKSTQQKIASILTAYDDLIENNLKRIKLLEEKAQLTYEEWFVSMKFPGHESVEIDKETGLPEGWKKVKLEDVLTLNYGKALKASNRIQGYYSVYGSSGIVGSHNEFLINGPGVIVGRKGNVGSVFWADDSFYAIDTVYYVTSELSLYYCYFYLKGESFVNNDAAVPGLSRKAAYLKNAIKPSSIVIDKFEIEIQKFFDLVRNLKKQNQLLKEARDILLPRLMTGMIDVENLDLQEIKE
ncbi:restriction endonuclease subunit S [Christiangramia sp.]|uniref:restriction endonuclease subunit S n=1 Tax=Christiangramia sp. TaxID=1931228 RepID=UPI00260FA470|nr:restriction endonuclease subunit S [Christiangramia sp.]